MIRFTERTGEQHAMTDLSFHPLAEIFPLIEGTEFQELVTSIKESGQLDPIITFEGAILDGRNRHRACKAAGVAPICEAFTGNDPVRFIIDKNIHRRHLTESQRDHRGRVRDVLSGVTYRLNALP
jgi:ParB-like chromosome segregation protein Spo0J